MMKKKLISQLLIFMIVCSSMIIPAGSAKVQAAAELLPNADFEEVVSAKPGQWVEGASGSVTSISDSVYVRSGNYSVKLDDTSAITSTEIESAHIPVTPGTTYRASVYAYDVEGTSQFYLQYWNSSNERIGAQYVSNPSQNQWNRLEIVGEAPAGTTYATLLLYLHMTNVGTSYFDNASLQAALSASDPNFGFEDVISGKPGNWSDFEGNSLYQSVTDIVYSGTYSVKLDDPSPVHATGMRSVHLPITPGEAYRASVMNYNVSGVSQLYLEYWNSSDERIDVVVGTNSASGSWQQLVLNRAAPPDAAYATILLYLHGTNIGSAYFDEAVFGPAPTEPLREFPLLVNDHPRLFFTSSDLPALRAKANDDVHTAFGLTGKQIWTSLENKARPYLDETDFTIHYYDEFRVTFPLPPEQPGPIPNPPGFETIGYPYWTAMSRAIEDRLEALSLAYVITQEQAFADKAKQYLLAMTTWDSWTDVGSQCEGITCLDTAHITLGVSMAYDTLYDLLTEVERTQIENALESKGLIPLYIDSTGRVDNNIEALRAIALGVGATAVLGKLPNANKYLTRAANYYQWYMDSRMSSGQQEGLMYSAYTMDNMMRAIDSISRATGLSEFIDHPYLNDFIVRWLTYFLVPGGGDWAKFSDSQYGSYSVPTLSVINNRLQDGHAGWYMDETRTESDLFMRFLYFNPQPVITQPDDWPASAVLDEIGWAALRSGWENDDTLFAFTSNNSRLGHNHYDQNSFQIGINRSWIAADPGYQDYTPGPANDFTVRMGHSTIQVDGQGQSELGGGSLTKGMLSPTYDYVKGSAAGAYTSPKLEKFDRHIVYMKPDYFVMFDDLKADIPRTFDWVLYNGGLSEMAVDGQTVPFGQTTQGNNLYVNNGRAALTAKFLSSSPMPITTQLYPGAESYGYSSKVSSGAPATDFRYLTVLKAAPVHVEGQYRATELLPPLETSSKLVKVVEAANTQLVFYRADTVGDYMTLEFNVDEAGTYALDTMFIQSPSYGKVQTYLDGQQIGGVYDGYNAEVQAAGPFHHGDVTLQAGTHTIRYEIVGKNAASDNYFLGVDTIKLTLAGSGGDPEPQIEKEIAAERVQGIGAIGAKIEREDNDATTDYVLFKTEGSEYLIEGIHSDADQSVVSRKGTGDVTGYKLSGGTFLQDDCVVLLQGEEPFNAAFDFIADTMEWQGIVELKQAQSLQLHASSAGQVMLDGNQLGSSEYSFDPANKLLTIQLSAGVYQIVVSEETTPSPTTTPTPTPSPTSTPVPTSTPTPSPTPSMPPANSSSGKGIGEGSDHGAEGRSKIRDISTDELKAAKDGKIEIVLSADTGEIILPSDAGKMLNGNRLMVTAGDVRVEITSELLMHAAAGASESEGKQGRFSLKMAALSTSDANQMLGRAAGNIYAQLNAASPVYDIAVSLITADGRRIAIGKFDHLLKVGFKIPSNADRQLLGIYLVGEAGQLEYKGGAIEGNWMETTGITDVTEMTKMMKKTETKEGLAGRYALLEYDKTFLDIPAGFWAAKVIKVLSAHHLIEGVDDEHFAPQRPITRAEFTALLVRILGVNEQADVPFSDVQPGDWYAAAIASAVKAGLVNGVSGNRFAPNEPVSREQMAVLLLRAYEWKTGKKLSNEVKVTGITSVITSGAGFKEFVDQADASEWARPFIQAAAENGIVQGKLNSRFAPKDATSRAEIAQAVYNLLEKIK
ncbi:S-layer homology domain-containing protein [Paenibacillus eucommiae]|uniref:SLH domain-containing protein n=1 Tax=Paenibacillus eucommiae TaxID=1355755 RepID=A0ABS4INT1_9BACL|nr:S-layer homology domain-containing protein [Paenibacillus eucommiae]MBP1988586.1 hypothetical protein [Paenibacillus eucommiae]